MFQVQLPHLRRDEARLPRSVFESIVWACGGRDLIAPTQRTRVPGPLDDLISIDDDGVRLQSGAAVGTLGWPPARELGAHRADDASSRLVLRFPFSAPELAAFMVDGVGYFIRERFGEWSCGPDVDALLEFGVADDEAALAALRGAYEAYRLAEKIAPPAQPHLESAARSLEREYDAAWERAMQEFGVRESVLSDAEYERRLNRVRERVALLDLPKQQARATADAALAHRRKALVQILLLPLEDVSDNLLGCELLRRVPANWRGSAIFQWTQLGEFDDSERSRRQWQASSELAELARKRDEWLGLSVVTVTDAQAKEARLVDLANRATGLEAELRRFDSPYGAEPLPSPGGREPKDARAARRLMRLRELGNDMEQAGPDGAWKVQWKNGAFRRLVSEERERGVEPHYPRGVRKDLRHAAEVEANKRRSGEFARLVGAL